MIVVTNQSGIARGLLCEQDLLAIHSVLVDQLADAGVIIDAFYTCPHLDTATVEAYRTTCDCRKPAVGMLRRAAADWGIPLRSSYLIGDASPNLAAGLAAGLAGKILPGGLADHLPSCVRAETLAQAAGMILERQQNA